MDKSLLLLLLLVWEFRGLGFRFFWCFAVCCWFCFGFVYIFFSLHLTVESVEKREGGNLTRKQSVWEAREIKLAREVVRNTSPRVYQELIK